jgi:hypothetical protein
MVIEGAEQFGPYLAPPKVHALKSVWNWDLSAKKGSMIVVCMCTSLVKDSQFLLLFVCFFEAQISYLRSW